jgi:hypothetical protein
MMQYVNNKTGRITITHETLIRESLLGKTAVRLALNEAEQQNIFKVIRRGKQSATNKYANIYMPRWTEVAEEYVKWQKRKAEIKQFNEDNPDFDESEPDSGLDEVKKCGDSLMEKPLSGLNGTLSGLNEIKKCGDSLLFIPVYYIPSIKRERGASLDSPNEPHIATSGTDSHKPTDSSHEPNNVPPGNINPNFHQKELQTTFHKKEQFPVVGLTVPRGELSFIEEEHEAGIRRWLVSLGLPSKKVKRMGFPTMMKYYNDETDSFIKSFEPSVVVPAATPAAARATAARTAPAVVRPAAPVADPVDPKLPLSCIKVPRGELRYINPEQLSALQRWFVQSRHISAIVVLKLSESEIISCYNDVTDTLINSFKVLGDLARESFEKILHIRSCIKTKQYDVKLGDYYHDFQMKPTPDNFTRFARLLGTNVEMFQEFDPSLLELALTVHEKPRFPGIDVKLILHQIQFDVKEAKQLIDKHASRVNTDEEISQQIIDEGI